MTRKLNGAVAGLLLATSIWAQPTVVSQTKEGVMPPPPALIKTIKQHNPQLSEAALLAGIRAYRHLREEGRDWQQRLTIVDFSRPSHEKRLWVLNMRTGDTEAFTYVAHGEASGLNVAHHFSNVEGSHASSMGVYLTGKTYWGRGGYSLRLYGLDRGFNNHAFERGIVMHPAWYVSPQFAKRYGRLGRTYGCFGLSQAIAPKVIATIKNGTILVAYYPNRQWLASSPYEQPIPLTHNGEGKA